MTNKNYCQHSISAIAAVEQVLINSNSIHHLP